MLDDMGIEIGRKETGDGKVVLEAWHHASTDYSPQLNHIISSKQD